MGATGLDVFLCPCLRHSRVPPLPLQSGALVWARACSARACQENWNHPVRQSFVIRIGGGNPGQPTARTTTSALLVRRLRKFSSSLHAPTMRQVSPTSKRNAGDGGDNENNQLESVAARRRQLIQDGFWGRFREIKMKSSWGILSAWLLDKTTIAARRRQLQIQEQSFANYEVVSPIKTARKWGGAPGMIKTVLPC